MMENTYWHFMKKNNLWHYGLLVASYHGSYQKDYDRLCEQHFIKDFNEFVKIKTIAGEMVSAISMLAYDLYNNHARTNTSQAVNMLRDMNAINQDTWETIYPFTRGRRYEGEAVKGDYNGDPFQLAIVSAADQTMRYILDNPELETTPNTQDMLDWQDDDEKDDYWEDDYIRHVRRRTFILR
jgi:hypothetical protein